MQRGNSVDRLQLRMLQEVADMLNPFERIKIK